MKRKEFLLNILIGVFIFGILSTFFLPGLWPPPSLDARRKTHALKTCVDLRNSLLEYFQDYGSWPIATNDQPVSTSSETGLMDCLSAFDSPQNPRGIAYFSAKPSRRHELPGLSTTEKDFKHFSLFDAWSRIQEPSFYYIFFDADGDGTLTVPDPSNPSEDSTIQTQVAVWSWGQDQTPRTEDDVFSY